MIRSSRIRVRISTKPSTFPAVEPAYVDLSRRVLHRVQQQIEAAPVQRRGQRAGKLALIGRLQPFGSRGHEQADGVRRTFCSWRARLDPT